MLMNKKKNFNEVLVSPLFDPSTFASDHGSKNGSYQFCFSISYYLFSNGSGINGRIRDQLTLSYHEKVFHPVTYGIWGVHQTNGDIWYQAKIDFKVSHPFNVMKPGRICISCRLMFPCPSWKFLA